MANRTERRIVLLGKVGAGKSATGNTILSRKRFPVSKNHGKLTTECNLRHSFKKTSQLTYKVLDTPGIADEDGMLPEDGFMIQQEIIKCFREPNVFVLVVDPDDCAMIVTVVRLLQKWFGMSILDYVVLAFTKRSIFKTDEYFHAFIRQKNLSELVTLFGSRLIQIENHGEGRGKSLRHLLSVIESVSRKGKSCFRFDPKPWYQFKKDFGLKGPGKDFSRPEDVKLSLSTEENPVKMESEPLYHHFRQKANDSNAWNTEEASTYEELEEDCSTGVLGRERKLSKPSSKQDKPTFTTFKEVVSDGELYGAKKKSGRQYRNEEKVCPSSQNEIPNDDETFGRHMESSPRYKQDSTQICRLDEMPHINETLSPGRKRLTRHDVCKTLECAGDAGYAIRNFKERPISSMAQLALIACDEENVQAVTNVINSEEVQEAIGLASSLFEKAVTGIGNFVSEVAEEIEKNRKRKELEEARKRAHFY